MVYQSRRDKQSVRYRQFQGGYAKVPASQLRAMLEGYRQRVFRRDEVRVFAARWEAAALHKDSQVSLYRIVNCQSKTKGHRRLPHADINVAVTKLNDLLPELEAKLAGLSDDEEPITAVQKQLLRWISEAIQ